MNAKKQDLSQQITKSITTSDCSAALSRRTSALFKMKWLSTASLLLLLGPSLAVDETKTPPLFFLQDPNDSLCLAGEVFKRCSIDTLFYVIGSPGTSTKRVIDEIHG